jgi:leucine efflux protein
VLHFTEFVVASVAIILLPGPGQIAILTATLSGGFKAGLKAVAGLLTGDVAIMTLTALGVATILGIYPGIAHIIRWAGGLYICWIGIGVLRSTLTSLTTAPVTNGPLNWYVRTVGITLLNPKAVLFFVSFFPLFMDPALGVAGSFLQMGALFTLLSGSYLVFFAWSGAAPNCRPSCSPLQVRESGSHESWERSSSSSASGCCWDERVRPHCMCCRNLS